MAEPFLAEIRICSFVFAPRGWALCNGQLLPINQNQALFSLLGTTFGGNGQVNFALPDFRGRYPMHVGNGHTLGERAGEQAVTLAQAQLPLHSHTLSASDSPTSPGVTNEPANQFFSRSTGDAYSNAPTPPSTVLAANTLSTVGGSQAHLNMQPYLTLSFVVALQGIFPSPT